MEPWTPRTTRAYKDCTAEVWLRGRLFAFVVYRGDELVIGCGANGECPDTLSLVSQSKQYINWPLEVDTLRALNRAHRLAQGDSEALRILDDAMI